MSRIAVVAHAYFPQDPRLRKETVAVADAGHEVHLICLHSEGEAHREESGSIHIARLPVSRDRSRGRLGYLLEYARFAILASAKLRQVDRRTPIDLVFVHNIPEQLVYVAYRLKRRGTRIILDIHDPLPELFADKYGLSERSAVRRLLTRMEIDCVGFADHVLVPTIPVMRRLMSLGVPEDKMTVVMNSPDGALAHRFGPTESRFVLVYHGSVFPRYGLDVVLQGLAASADRVPMVELHIFSSDVDPAHLAYLKSLAARLGLSDRVAFSDYAAPLALSRILAAADAGVSPLRRSSHIDLAYPSKLFEYLECGLPVIAASTPAILEVFGDTPVDFYEPHSPEGFADALVALVGRTRSRSVTPRGSLLRSDLSWNEMGRRCVDVVERLAYGGSAPILAQVYRSESEAAGT